MIGIIIIIIIIYYAIYNFGKRIYNKESFIADMPLLSLNDKYNQRKREMKNINYVLKRPIEKGNITINNLNSNFNPGNWDIYNKFITLSKEEQLQKQDNTILEKIKNNPRLRNRKIFNIYNEFFYYDELFPKEPISIDYALNPDEFIKNNPFSYPSYIIIKDNLKNVKPNEKELTNAEHRNNFFEPCTGA